MPTDEQKKRLWVAVETKRISEEERQTSRIRDGLKEATEPVLTRLREFGVQDAIDDIESEIDVKPIKEAYQDLYAEVGSLFAMESFEGLLPQKQKQDDTLEDMWMERLREFAATEAGTRIVDVTQYTVEQVRGVLQEGIQEGWGVEKIARQLESSDAISRVRARRIARTEIVSASNEGSMMGARSTRLNLKKIWIDTPDSRTRETHIQAGSQQPVDIDEPFQVGGYDADYPGDLSLPAEEVVNCRCTVGYQEYG